ncbi:MAG: hypothetical protein FWC56_04030 [Phycisphaerae bacterium]|nr:hypothetical protein [Phycisphaerae bacterium]
MRHIKKILLGLLLVGAMGMEGEGCAINSAATSEFTNLDNTLTHVSNTIGHNLTGFIHHVHNGIRDEAE